MEDEDQIDAWVSGPLFLVNLFLLLASCFSLLISFALTPQFVS